MRCNRLLATLGLLAGACLDPALPGNLVPATVEDDPALPRIEVNGTILHAEAFGDPRAPMIVVLHGGPGGDYRAFLPYRVLADDGYSCAVATPPLCRACSMPPRCSSPRPKAPSSKMWMATA